MEENNNENRLICSHCGTIIEDVEDFETINGQVICSDCVEMYTSTCDRCGATIWNDDAYGDDFTILCASCYHNHYVRCCCSDAMLHVDDEYSIDGDSYCSE